MISMPIFSYDTYYQTNSRYSFILEEILENTNDPVKVTKDFEYIWSMIIEISK